MRKAKKKKSGVWKAIAVVCVLLVIALGALFFVLYYRNNLIKDVQAREEAKQEEYTALITDVSLPAGWDDATLQALQSQALAAYDTSFLSTIDLALDGNNDAIEEVLDKKESSQPEAVSEYTTLFSDLDAYPVSLAKLVVSDSSTLPMVLSYTSSDASSSDTVSTNENGEEILTADLSAGIPSLKTFDTAWAFKTYGDGLMATDGSAPTTIAMIFSYMLQDNTFTPWAVAEWAAQYGYDVTPVSDNDSIFSAAAWSFGINMTPLVANTTYINTSMASGGTVVAQVGTEDNNHFIVILNQNDDGTWTIMDPTNTAETETVNPDDLTLIDAWSFW